MKHNGIILLCCAGFVAVVASLYMFEDHFLRSSEVVTNLDKEFRKELYPTAIQGLMEQSNYFSSWAIALIVAGWIILIYEQKLGQAGMVIFMGLCLSACFVLFFGQLVHQIVIADIREDLDPLTDQSVWDYLRRQYLFLMLAGLFVMAGVARRYMREKAN